MNLEPYSHCIICGSERNRIIADVSQLRSELDYLDRFWRNSIVANVPDYMLKDHIFFTHTYDAQLLQCYKCGHVTRNPRITPGEIAEVYAQDHYHRDWIEAAFEPYRQSFVREMPRLTQMVGNRARVLEVGSHIGGFLSAAREFGWEPQGVDVNPILSQHALSKGLNVFVGTLEDAKYEDNSFDGVFVWLCFEMLPDPWNSLQEIWRILKPGGWLFISVPNGSFRSTMRRFIDYRVPRVLRQRVWNMMAFTIILGFTFQFGYTDNSMSYLLRNSGFNTINISNQHYEPIINENITLPHVLREKRIDLSVVYQLSDSIASLSFRRAVIGPWLEVSARKAT